MPKDQKIIRLTYQAERTALKFHKCDDFVRLVMGPYGSGKSTMCVMEIILRANAQRAVHGVRRSRWAIVRNTYPELTSTTIKTWQMWMPDEICPLNMGAPIRGRARYPLADGTTVDLEVFFLALDRPKDIKKLGSLELTGVYFNEFREISRAVFDASTGRVGRFPSKKQGGTNWTGIIADTNPPDTDHWLYRLFEVDKPAMITPKGEVIRYRIFKQPPALLWNNTRTAMLPNPNAENIQNLEGGHSYYFKQIVGKSPDWIRVYVEGMYGSVQTGRPVYHEYNDAVHCPFQADIEPMRGLPLVIGFDFGLNPSAAFAQFDPSGKLVFIDELVSDSMGLRQFIQELFRPTLVNRYFGMMLQIVGDPAGEQRSQTDERTCYEILREEGYEGTPVHTNAWLTRRDALSSFLLKRDGFALSPRCKTIRAAFLGKYYYQRMRIGEEERYRDEPAKNFYSHIMNAAEYASMSPRIGYTNNAAAGGNQARRVVVSRSSKGWT